MDMEDKTLIAAYVAKEMQRVEKRLKDLTARSVTPSDAEQQEIFQDIETTLNRLQSALAQIPLEETDEEPEKTVNA